MRRQVSAPWDNLRSVGVKAVVVINAENLQRPEYIVHKYKNIEQNRN